MKKDLYLLEKKEIIVLVILLTVVALLSFTVGIRMGKKLKDTEDKIVQEHRSSAPLAPLQAQPSDMHAPVAPAPAGHDGAAPTPGTPSPTGGETTAGAHAPAPGHDTSAAGNHDQSVSGKEPSAEPAKEEPKDHSGNPPEKPAEKMGGKPGADHGALKPPTDRAGVPENAVLDDQLVRAVEGEKVEPVSDLTRNTQREESLQAALPGGKKAKKKSVTPASPHKTVPSPSTESVGEPVGDDAPSADGTPAAGTSGRYTIQLGSHPTKAEAQQQVAVLKEKGVPAYVVEVRIPGKGVWYRVIVGLFQTTREAKSYAMTHLKGKVDLSQYIVQKME